jgi:hypothetical protein
MPAELALAVVSLLTGAVAMLVLRATSNPARLRMARNVITAHVLEMRIYQDDLVLILKALAAALAGNLRYLRLMLVPLIAIAAVVAPIVVQLDARFDRSPLHAGETALVSVTCAPGIDVMRAAIDLEVDKSAVVERPRVRVPARREVHWRVRAERPGTPAVTIRVASARYQFRLAAEPGTGTIGRLRTQSALDALLHPGLPPLPHDASIARIEVRYPPARYSILGWRTHWLVVLVAWSMVGALILKRVLRIEI